MKFLNTQKIALLAGLAIGSLGMANAAECDSVGAEVKKAVADSPAKVLVIVDDMISKNEACACEIVKAAIDASGADNALVREIVVTAVSSAQGMAATIAECAVAQAPDAAGEIKAGLSEVFAGAKHAGGKEVIYADDVSAKEVVVEEVEEDLGPEPVVISGVYLIAPVAAGDPSLRDEDGNIITEEDIREEQERLIEILRRRERDGRDPDDSTTTSDPPSPADPKV